MRRARTQLVSGGGDRSPAEFANRFGDVGCDFRLRPRTARAVWAVRMKLDIPAGDFAGYIFDLDGTLVDTMPLHYRAWDAAMRAVGLDCPLDEDLFYSLGGVPTRRVAHLIAEHYGLTVDVEHVFHTKEKLFREIQADAQLIEPVVTFA